MIDILKRELKSGMAINAEKELSSKWKVTISYEGMQSAIDLPKTCTPGCEKELCRKVIDTALSTMYINAGNLAEAKKWLNGEFWKKSIDKDELLNDEDILKDIHLAEEMYKDGELIEACDLLESIVYKIREVCQ